MAGTLEGGRRAAATNKAKHGEDFYKKLGALGGKFGKKDGTVKGFAAVPGLAKRAGVLGGRKSKRTKKEQA